MSRSQGFAAALILAWHIRYVGDPQAPWGLVPGWLTWPVAVPCAGLAITVHNPAGPPKRLTGTVAATGPVTLTASAFDLAPDSLWSFAALPVDAGQATVIVTTTDRGVGVMPLASVCSARQIEPLADPLVEAP